MTEKLEKIKKVLKIRRCSQNTITNYVSCIKRFLDYFENQDIEKLSEEKILDYLTENFIDKDLKPATYNLNKSAIIYFYSIIYNRELNKKWLPDCKIPKKYHFVFSKKDIIFLLRNADMRLQLMIILAFGCGLRREEVASLNFKNIDVINRKIEVIAGKGEKNRYTILPDFVLKILGPYYRKNEKQILKSGGYLFPSGKCNSSQSHIHSNTIGCLFHNLLKKLNYDKDDISFHTLRRSFATLYIKNGGDIWILKDLLGHKSINCTLIYVQMARNYSDLIVPLKKDVR